MKGAITLFLLFFTITVFGQISANQKRIKEIPSEINKAVAAEDYEKAARLKEEQKLREEMEAALKVEDYQKASDLKGQLDAGTSTESASSGNEAKIAELEKEMQKAVDNEDYKKAGDLKREIEALQSGSHTSVQSANSNNNTTARYSGSAPTIDFSNQVYLLKSNGSVESLEKATGKLTTSGGGFGGYASATSSYMLEGSKSPVRLSYGNLSFAVKVYQGQDPSDNIKLLKMEVRGRAKNRYADQYKSQATFGHSESGKVSGNQIEINFKRIEGDIFEISIVGDIEPGEYTFQYIDKLFAFGID